MLYFSGLFDFAYLNFGQKIIDLLHSWKNNAYPLLPPDANILLLRTSQSIEFQSELTLSVWYHIGIRKGKKKLGFHFFFSMGRVRLLQLIITFPWWLLFILFPFPLSGENFEKNFCSIWIFLMCLHENSELYIIGRNSTEVNGF